MASYTEEIVATITLPEDDEQAKTLLRCLESLVIHGLRRAHPDIQLKNKNSPRCENVRKSLSRLRENGGFETVQSVHIRLRVSRVSSVFTHKWILLDKIANCPRTMRAARGRI